MARDLNSPLSANDQEKTSQITFFRIKTAHDAYLAVRLQDGQLSQHRNPEEDEDFVPLIAIHINELPHQIFLTTDRPDKPQIWVHHYTNRGTVLSVNMKHSGPENAHIAFEDPLTLGKHFTTRPFAENEVSNHVVGDCHHILGWEEFSPEAVDVSPRLLEEAGHIAALFSYNVKASKIVDFIKHYKGTDLQPVLDSLLPFIHWDELHNLSSIFSKDKALLQKLQKVSSPNIWLNKAIPNIIAWHAKRQNDKMQSIALPKKILSPVEECKFAWSGSDGAFAGFFHAIAHLTRRAIKPRRKICILTTQRNEGIYLLEWIAYHRALGIEHFFIYSNNNADKSDLILEELSKKGIITWIKNEVDEKTSPQFKAYGHAFTTLPDILNFEWCFVLDGDEFVTLDPELFPTITDYLNLIERKETDAVAINWRFIASSLNVDGLSDLAQPLTDRNQRIVSSGAIGEGWRLVKSLCRPNKTLHSRPHHPVWYKSASYNFRLSNGEQHEFLQPPPGFPRDPAFADHCFFDKIYISHFYFKSMAEWTWKHARNSGADPTKKMDSSRYNNQWANAFGLQMRDAQYEHNKWVLDRATQTHKELAALRAMPSLRKAENQVRQVVESLLYELRPQIKKENIVDKIDPQWHFILQDLELELRGHIPQHSEE
ncbi:glycosyltransferase family 92 protein [Aristophania vespae]|uniref:Glycosyltransferase family 92 protein n=1 Tax=Aristophania vespae TaxID=2697033 RepID=A0A6P1N9C0_9PROT|nr:glycosyltransferase family 2 protein [Aristophania vespae]QHI95145.1 glycosyltransferase family 92 protein [Aristophania vespae]